ncbi:ribonuclease T2-like [Rhizoclosmatium hyalinum]|nr:ribonuclease T2-like [Rhizoclosmatium hyalinum]
MLVASLVLSACASALSLPSCDASSVSCKAKADSCCVPTNGVMVLAVQWLPGYCAGTGNRCTHDVLDRLPKDKWTIHAKKGLWPDDCDGFQVSDCDPKRTYRDAAKRIKDSPLYKNMTDLWVSFKGGLDKDFNDFWSHEFAKHGTCYSPADPKCVGSTYGADVERFFHDTLVITDKYNIHAALRDSGIVPSKTAGYKSEDIQKAIVAAFGDLSVGLVCKGPYLAEIRLGLIGVGGGQVAKNGDVYLPSTCPRYGVMYALEHPDHPAVGLVENEDNDE